MKLNRVFLAAITTFILSNCARQTTPEGGPKDTIKPVLVNSSPEENQTNFKGKKIEMLFSEDVKLKDPKDQIIISPSMGKDVKYTATGNKITIDPPTRWHDSTTYNILFRESIQDITESNPTEDLHLAFSTSTIIDTLFITGRVVEARSETIPENITVALYESDTFDIFTDNSTYFTKTNKKGTFKITNLKAGDYFLYAYDDKNKNLKVESTNEKYAFKAKPIKIKQTNDSIQLNLVKVDSRPIKLNSNRSTTKTTTLRFNKSLTDYSTPNLTTNTLTTYGDNFTEIQFHYDESKPIKDSIQIQIIATDSLDQHFDSLIYIKQTNIKAVKQTYSLSTEAPVVNFETGFFELRGKTNIPTREFNTDSIYITVDSLTKINFKKDDIKYSTKTKKFTVTTKIDTAFFSTNLPPNKDPKQTNKQQRPKKPILVLGKAFATSIYGDSSKLQKINIPPKQTIATGLLRIEIETNEKNYIIELLNATNEITDVIENKKKHTFERLNGEYKIRITSDTNANHKWDAGNILKREEPEKTFFYRGRDKKYLIPIRENWEVEIKIKF
jgi:uncharacterized protein (DUF2141 family)